MAMCHQEPNKKPIVGKIFRIISEFCWESSQKWSVPLEIDLTGLLRLFKFVSSKVHALSMEAIFRCLRLPHGTRQQYVHPANIFNLLP